MSEPTEPRAIVAAEPELIAARPPRRWVKNPSVLLFVLVAGLITGLVFWLRSIGGADALFERYGLWAPILSVPLHAVIAVAPIPSEVFAVAAATAYGWPIGTAMAWAGWTLGSMMQWALARRGAVDFDLDAKLDQLPRFLAKLPVHHPLFLICVRWVPAGFHIANIAAGVRGVPWRRHLWTAAVGSFPIAVLFAGIGAGISLL